MWFWNVCFEKLQAEPPHNKATGVGLPKPFGIHTMLLFAQILDIESQNSMFVLLGFGIIFVPFFLSLPSFLLVGMVMFTLCHCILELIFIGLLSSAQTLETFGIIGNGHEPVGAR
jgi:hypothetical protein